MYTLRTRFFFFARLAPIRMLSIGAQSEVYWGARCWLGMHVVVQPILRSRGNEHLQCDDASLFPLFQHAPALAWGRPITEFTLAMLVGWSGCSLTAASRIRSAARRASSGCPRCTGGGGCRGRRSRSRRRSRGWRRRSGRSSCPPCFAAAGGGGEQLIMRKGFSLRDAHKCEKMRKQCAKTRNAIRFSKYVCAYLLSHFFFGQWGRHQEYKMCN